MMIKKINKNKGQSLVELALVLPIIIILFIGILQFGFLLNDYISLTRAVSEAARYGSTLVGYQQAEILIVSKLLDSLGENIRKENLKIISHTNQKYGPYFKNASGSIINSNNQVVTSFPEFLFFRSDNYTKTNFNDDFPCNPTWFVCSYVKVTVEYDHQIIIPFAELINAKTFKLSASSTWPVTTINPNLFSNNLYTFQLHGAVPIAVNENQCVYTGSPITIKGDWIVPGGFGWLDLSVYYNSGQNPNAGPNDLAAWISNPYSSNIINITPPQIVYSMTGQKNASSVRDALNNLLGKDILVPIYDTTGSQGNNAYYHIIGLAIFKLNSIQNYPDLTATYIKTVFKVN